ncbi:beta-phosphoglucomutase family hydrolase [Nocardia cyriacigeorgica]|uniref:Beta-phosphoglucomutase family hydrolase n=1 Tax=Nocardia cyriacigeorgica TaxID=135487 RepID=A0A6P1D244_9NOCA|nr:beta-phosphoglucomutase family hydrolase [Nocardia cyriacigeorgica]NEW43270.1 beta-phosphoglucomutase family hydrolase [Nocardia cyriacigeorgica]
MRLDELPTTPARTANGYAAVVFDMDGVVTDTASVHAAAWKALFDEALPALGGTSQRPFDPIGDYRELVDGRSREDGVRAFLASRGVDLPEGRPDDAPDKLSVAGLAARKQNLFAEELARSGVRVFADASRLLRGLRTAGVPTALVTASRNSAAVLDAAGIADMFSVRVDGTDALRLALPGKPDPAMFLEAAHRLGFPPSEVVVFEDASAGVRAAAHGGFGLVVGVDHTGSGAQLDSAGADVVVTDLADLPLVPHPDYPPRPGLRWGGGASGESPGGWNLIYDDYDPAEEGTREALCTTGNGYWASRGALPGTRADGVHYPGTYFAGVYNRRESEIDGHTTETEHLVNAPDWAYLTVRRVDGSELTLGVPDMVSHHQNLDLRAGVLTCIDRYRDSDGNFTRITSRRFHSVTDPHLAAVELTIDAENWSGTLTITSAINGRVANRNVAADEALGCDHLRPRGYRELDAETVVYEAITNQSAITIATATRTHIECAGNIERRFQADDRCPGHHFSVHVRAGVPVVIEKVAAVATSRDPALSTAVSDVGARIERAPSLATLLAAHVTAWARLWDRFGIRLDDGRRHRLALNLHIFHVLQATIATLPDIDAGLPARGLHGEAYRGHIFWDELFVYPMLTLRRPELTRSFLQYRYRRLRRARANALAAGLSGALFPWQSGSDGREETPTMLLNVRNGQWVTDNSSRQRHVGLAIAYSVWQYYQTTGDQRFLIDCGAEIIVEVARLFTSLAVHDPADDRYDISGIMGPDEYHDGYPDSPGQGIRNNTYTNVLASWVLCHARDITGLLDGLDCEPLWDRLQLTANEPALWDRIGRRLRIPFHSDGIISQFEGYEDLDEFDWHAYTSRYGHIERLDLILQAEGDTTNRYKVSKQADVLMLFYLFSAEELRAMFEHLGYTLPPELIPRTVSYYISRTSHGSTLSRLAHAWVLARTDREMSWWLFTQALEADLADTQRGTTREGVHLGAMAGTADMILRCYSGIETRHNTLRLHPVLPTELNEVEFTVSYRGQPINVTITHTRITLRLQPSAAAPIRVHVEDTECDLGPGQVWEVELEPKADLRPS